MTFEKRLEWLKAEHEALITRKNEAVEGNGVIHRRVPKEVEIPYPYRRPCSSVLEV